MKLPDVNCTYGAPMGRREHHHKPETKTVSLFRVILDSGGYDSGGAYWGSGIPLYCAMDLEGDYREFTRAHSRIHAAEILGLTNDLLIRRVM